MLHIQACEFNAAGLNQLFPGYSAGGQETSSGLVVLDKIAGIPAPAPAKPPVSMEAAQKTLLTGIAKNSDPQDKRLGQRANTWLKTGPRVLSLYRRPALKRYASLDSSAQEAKRIIETAKKTPALMRKADPKGVLRQSLKMDAPRPGRTHRFYSALKEMRPLIQSAAAPKKIISLKQLPSMLPRMGRRLLLAPGMV